MRPSWLFRPPSRRTACRARRQFSACGSSLPLFQPLTCQRLMICRDKSRRAKAATSRRTPKVRFVGPWREILVRMTAFGLFCPKIKGEATAPPFYETFSAFCLKTPGAATSESAWARRWFYSFGRGRRARCRAAPFRGEIVVVLVLRNVVDGNVETGGVGDVEDVQGSISVKPAR